MEIINVKEICGEYCIDENDVQELSKQLFKIFKTNTDVILDFRGVDTVLTAFFNGLLSELFSKFNYQEIHDRIKFTESTSEAIHKKYSRSLENAKRFYSSSRDVQDQISDRVNKIFNAEINLNEPLSAAR